MLFHASPQFVRMLDLERQRAAAGERLAAEAQRRHHDEPSFRARTVRAVADRVLGLAAVRPRAEAPGSCASCPAAS
jgi:hypothetical protein